MKFYDAVAVGISHMQQNQLRTGLSIFGILIGVTSVLCMMAIGDGAKKIIADDLEKLGGPNQVRFWASPYVYRRGKPRKPTTERYTLEDAYAIEAECPNVLFVLPQNYRSRKWVTTRHGAKARTYIEGVTEDYARGMRWGVQHGRFFLENDINNALQVCVLGSNAARELFGDVSPIGQEVKIRVRRNRSIRLRVIGVMSPKGRILSHPRLQDDSLYIPLTTSQQRFAGNRHVESLNIFLQKDTEIYSVVESVKSILRKRHRGVDNFINYQIPKLRIKQLERLEKVIKIALGGIAGFSLFVSGIGIMNICLVSVGEKTQEIGLRKSVGARRIDIFYQFLTESICLCLCGGVLGIGGGWLAAHGMARVAVRIVPIVDVWPVVLSTRWIAISVLFSIFMGITFGVYPAIRAARMTPIDALRTDT